MGNSNWNSQAYRNYSAKTSAKTRQEIFTNTDGCHDDLNPVKFSCRESCDSDKNPNSTPVIIGVDETGSMGVLAEQIIKKGLGVIVEEIINRKPIQDPHIMLAALGDAYCDDAPIQVTQFEADTVITEQIEKFNLEGGGGGNGGESYPLLWYFSLYKTKCDSFTKRNRKGYIFTVGDEAYHDTLEKEHIKNFIGFDIENDLNAVDVLTECKTEWNVFHLIVPTSATEHQDAINKWREILGERAIVIKDYKKLAEVIVSTIQLCEGQNYRDVIGSWDNETNIVVADSLKAYSDIQVQNDKSKTEIVKL